MIRLALAVAILLGGAWSAQAAVRPRPGDQDPRIQTVAYDPDQVTLLEGQLGFQMMLEFGPDERIENVSVGDALGWQVTPNRKANLLFLKPIDRLAPTNMTVVTTVRRYSFELRVAPKASRNLAPYAVRFTYPPAAIAMIIAPEFVPDPPPLVANANYRVTGSAENAPARIFDDGRVTYFEWPQGRAVPAIFAVAADGAENLVNYRVRGDFLVVEQLSPQFVLRNGKQVAQVLNQGYVQAVAVAKSGKLK